MLEKKLHEAVRRFNEINGYTKKLMLEQETPELPEPPAEGDVPAEDGVAPEDGIAPEGDLPAPPADGAEGGDLAPEEDTTEEIDITDLVNMTKSIKKDLDNKLNGGDDAVGKMDDVFSKLTELEAKLSDMDIIMQKIENLGNKIEQMRDKTPEEKLEMRSLDSYPFNQKPQQFFNTKQEEMRASGKNEYVLTKQDVRNYSVDNIKDSFNADTEDDIQY